MNFRHFRLFLRRFLCLAWKTWFHPKDSPARLTPKRFAMFLVIIPALGMLQLVHWLGFLLDELFFPGYRKVEVKAPLFILGVPRSGTTLLQRVLSRDEDQFTGYTLAEQYFAPSIVEWHFWRGVARVDRALGGFGEKLLRVVDRRIFRDIKSIHPTSLFWHEEDEMLFFPLFSTGFLLYIFPFREELHHLVYFDAQTPGHEQQLIMEYHKACIQRHLYVHGPHKRYMAKNILSSAKLNAFRKTFPDACIVCNVRSPYDCVPSNLSLVHFLWRQFDNGGDPIEVRDAFSEVLHHLYQHPMRVLQDWPEQQRAVVLYPELRADLRGVVTRLYAQFGLETTPAAARALEEEFEKASRYSSRHRYTLDAYNLTPEMILEEFRDVFEFYGFDTTPHQEAPAETNEQQRLENSTPVEITQKESGHG